MLEYATHSLWLFRRYMFTPSSSLADLAEVGALADLKPFLESGIAANVRPPRLIVLVEGHCMCLRFVQALILLCILCC